MLNCVTYTCSHVNIRKRYRDSVYHRYWHEKKKTITVMNMHVKNIQKSFPWKHACPLGFAYLDSEGRHRCVVGGRRRTGEHSAALQYQAHCQVLPHTLPCHGCGHWRVARARAHVAFIHGRWRGASGAHKRSHDLTIFFWRLSLSHIQEDAGWLLLCVWETCQRRQWHTHHPVICGESLWLQVSRMTYL